MSGNGFAPLNEGILVFEGPEVIVADTVGIPTCNLVEDWVGDWVVLYFPEMSKHDIFVMHG